MKANNKKQEKIILKDFDEQLDCLNTVTKGLKIIDKKDSNDWSIDGLRKSISLFNSSITLHYEINLISAKNHKIYQNKLEKYTKRIDKFEQRVSDWSNESDLLVANDPFVEINKMIELYADNVRKGYIDIYCSNRAILDTFKPSMIQVENFTKAFTEVFIPPLNIMNDTLKDLRLINEDQYQHNKVNINGFGVTEKVKTNTHKTIFNLENTIEFPVKFLDVVNNIDRFKSCYVNAHVGNLNEKEFGVELFDKMISQLPSNILTKEEYDVLRIHSTIYDVINLWKLHIKQPHLHIPRIDMITYGMMCSMVSGLLGFNMKNGQEKFTKLLNHFTIILNQWKTSAYKKNPELNLKSLADKVLTIYNNGGDSISPSLYNEILSNVTSMKHYDTFMGNLMNAKLNFDKTLLVYDIHTNLGKNVWFTYKKSEILNNDNVVLNLRLLLDLYFGGAPISLSVLGKLRNMITGSYKTQVAFKQVDYILAYYCIAKNLHKYSTDAIKAYEKRMDIDSFIDDSFKLMIRYAPEYHHYLINKTIYGDYEYYIDMFEKLREFCLISEERFNNFMAKANPKTVIIEESDVKWKA